MSVAHPGLIRLIALCCVGFVVSLPLTVHAMSHEAVPLIVSFQGLAAKACQLMISRKVTVGELLDALHKELHKQNLPLQRDALALTFGDEDLFAGCREDQSVSECESFARVNKPNAPRWTVSVGASKGSHDDRAAEYAEIALAIARCRTQLHDAEEPLVLFTVGSASPPSDRSVWPLQQLPHFARAWAEQHPVCVINVDLSSYAGTDQPPRPTGNNPRMEFVGNVRFPLVPELEGPSNQQRAGELLHELRDLLALARARGGKAVVMNCVSPTDYPGLRQICDDARATYIGSQHTDSAMICKDGFGAFYGTARDEHTAKCNGNPPTVVMKSLSQVEWGDV